MLIPSQNASFNQEVSTENLKEYFLFVVNVANSGNEFSINLDDVWSLAYRRKDHAVKSLRKNFIENVDFQLLPQKGERLSNGQIVGGSDVYLLTPQCMEFLIARKNREVFEVYRQVFHNAVAFAKAQKTVTKWLPLNGFEDAYQFSNLPFISYGEVVDYFNLIRNRHEEGCLFPVALSEVKKMLGVRLDSEVSKILYGRVRSAHTYEEDLDFYVVCHKIYTRQNAIPSGEYYLSVRAFGWLLEKFAPVNLGMLYKVFETYSLPSSIKNQPVLYADAIMQHEVAEALALAASYQEESDDEHYKADFAKIIKALANVNRSICA